MKYDKWFILSSLMLILIIALDIRLTYVGLGLGFSEGNMFLLGMMKEAGVKLTLFLVAVVSLMSVWSLNVIHHHVKDKTNVMFCILMVIICIRSYVIGLWVALINIKISL